jgi:endonuclease IV
MTRELLVGGHMSIAGGIHNAFAAAERVGCAAIQIFLKNSNQWKGKHLTEEDRELYSQARKRSGNIPVVAHNSYLINLASDLLISLLTLSPRPRVWISSVLVWDYGARL